MTMKYYKHTSGCIWELDGVKARCIYTTLNSSISNIWSTDSIHYIRKHPEYTEITKAEAFLEML